MTVISLCDRSGVMVKPWIDAGYNALTIDIEPAQHNFCRHVQADILDDVVCWWRYEPATIIFAFPPCTDLAISGAKHFKDKGLAALIHALQLVETCRDYAEQRGAPWMLENPVGTLSTYWRDPDYSFDPCDYGDPYTKKTWIWCGHGFVMPEKIQQGDMFKTPTTVEPSAGSLIYNMPDSIGRQQRRSITPNGFARAVFQANHRRQVAA